MVIRRPKVEVTAARVDEGSKSITERDDVFHFHERVVAICSSFDFAAAIFGPRWVGVYGFVFHTKVSPVKGTLRLPPYLLAITGRHVAPCTPRCAMLRGVE